MVNLVRNSCALALVFVLFAVQPIFAAVCEVSTSQKLQCDLSTGDKGAAPAELAEILKTTTSRSVREDAARYLIELDDGALSSSDPQLMADAFIVLGNTVRDDSNWIAAAELIISTSAEAPIDNRDYLAFLARYAHKLRMAGLNDQAVELAQASLGDGPLPNNGRDYEVFPTIQMMSFDGHEPSIALLDAWAGKAPPSNDPTVATAKTVIDALDGDPQAQLLIGKMLVEGQEPDLSRVQNRYTGRPKGGPYNAKRGAEFLRNALDAGLEEARAPLKAYEDKIAAQKKREAEERAAEAKRKEEERIAAEKARQKLIEERKAKAALQTNRLDEYLKSQRADINRLGVFWNSCVAEAGGNRVAKKYCDCIVTRSVELMGQARANVALATGVGLSQSRLRDIVLFCVDLSRG